MEFAVGLVIGFIIGVGVVFLIFELIPRLIKDVDDSMEENLDFSG